MMGLSRRDPNVVARTINASKVTWLGRIGDSDFGTYGGREYQVDVSPSDPENYSRRTDELWVIRVTHEQVGGSDFEHHSRHRALLVPSGTYQRFAEKAAARPVAEKPMRSWDALATLPVMQRREPVRVSVNRSASALGVLETLPAQSEQEKAVIAGAVDLLDRSRPPGVVEIGGNQPPDRSPAAIVEFLASRGVELTLARGRLVARSRTPIRADLRELIERSEELLVGVMRGSPVLCSSCGESATTVVFPLAPMCREHAQ